MTHASRAVAFVAFSFVGLATLVSCERRGGERFVPKDPPPLSAEKIQRGRTACRTFVDQLCECAGAHPDDAALARRCREEKTRPEALEMTLSVAAREPLGARELERIQATSSRIMNACIEGLATLDPVRCPRTSADHSSSLIRATPALPDGPSE